jgi:hypothetical protein
MLSYYMKFILYFVLLTGLLNLLSCSNSTRECKLKQVDSLIDVIKNVKEKVSKTDLAVYRNIHKKVYETNSIFKRKITDRIMDKQFMNDFAVYTSVEENFDDLTKRLTKATNEFIFTAKQLNNLKSDLQNNAIHDKDKMTQYVNDEKTAVTKLSQDIEGILTSSAKQKELYDKVHIKIEKYAEEISSKKK